MDVFKEAIDLWGVTAQLDMVIEECTELTLALMKRTEKRMAQHLNK